MKQLIKDLEKALENVEWHDDHDNIDKVVLYLKDIEATAKLIATKAERERTSIEIMLNA